MSRNPRLSPSGKDFYSIIIYDENGVSYEVASIQFTGFGSTFSEDGSYYSAVYGPPEGNQDGEPLVYDTDSGTYKPVADVGLMDVGGNPIVNHYNYRSSWTGVVAGSGSFTIGTISHGMDVNTRRVFTIEIDVEDNDQSNAVKDVFVVLAHFTTAGTGRLVNIADGTADASSISIIGPCSGYSYTVAFGFPSKINVSLAKDSTIARNAQVTISAEPVRSGP